MKTLLFVACCSLSLPTAALQEWLINEYSSKGALKNSYSMKMNLADYNSFGNKELDGGKLDSNLKSILNGCIAFDEVKKGISIRMNRLRAACKTPEKLKIRCDFYEMPELIGLPYVKTIDQSRNIKVLEITGCVEPMPARCSGNYLNQRKYIRDLAFLNWLEKCADDLAAQANIKLNSPIDNYEPAKKEFDEHYD